MIVHVLLPRNRYPLRVNESEEATAPHRAWLQLAEWGPTGSQLVMVLDNDIYYKASGAAQARVVRLTASGKQGVVFNGVPDWLYEGTYALGDTGGSKELL